jgi:hypothetical protein
MESLEAEVSHSRYIVCRLILDCLRVIDRTRVHSGQLTNDETIIGMALLILENEGRAPTISKLSFYTGVPRATVSRIVDRLVALRVVVRSGRKLQIAKPVDETAVSNARKFWMLIDEAARQLALLGRIATQRVEILDRLLLARKKPMTTPG